LPFAKADKNLQKLLASAVRFQAKSVFLDPYANAFYADTTRVSQWNTDTTTFLSYGGTHTPAMTNHLHERKFEVDSLCAFFELSVEYANATGDLTPFDASWESAALRAVGVLREQQTRDTRKNSGAASAPYRFERMTTRPSDTLMDGVGAPSRACGLIASGFRPSDDACMMPYNIAQNAMAVVQLRALAQLASSLAYTELSVAASSLASDVDAAVQKSGIFTHPATGQKVYAFEVDGFGNALYIDDANIPSLLALPVLGYVGMSDPVYLATRQFVLSERTNPWYFEVQSAPVVGAVGSQHTGYGRIWPMSLMVRALTTNDENEIAVLLTALKNSTCGTGLMHESFDGAGGFTRAWFSWANSFFGDMIRTLLITHPRVLT
jgi:meiotically up-regulated gene 157 (Mug157) protein